MDSFSSLNSVIWNHNSKHCLFQHNLKRRFQLHNYQHRVSLLHGAREHIKFQTWSSHSVHCGVLTAQLKFEVRCSKWRRRYTPCKSNDVDIQKWTTNKACICSFYCHIVKKKTHISSWPICKNFYGLLGFSFFFTPNLSKWEIVDKKVFVRVWTVCMWLFARVGEISASICLPVIFNWTGLHFWILQWNVCIWLKSGQV